jgi:hypothetical protein
LSRLAVDKGIERHHAGKTEVLPLIDEHSDAPGAVRLGCTAHESPPAVAACLD